MKKKFLTILFFTFLLPVFTNAQKSNKDILKNTNIKEIEEYLKNAHPDDPKKSVLKPKLIALKNAEWTKGARTAKPMEARPVISDIPKSIMRNPNSDDAEEFKKLITETSAEHKDKTAKLLNAMFNEDITRKEAILLFKNNSDCNIVLRIEGKDYYNLAVPARGENFIVLNKGSYTLNSNICDMKYISQKDIKKSIFVTIGNPGQTETEMKSTHNEPEKKPLKKEKPKNKIG
jgi:DNA-binding transcriptional MerR regulator